MEPDGVRPVRRPGGEYASQGAGCRESGMDLEDVPAGLVEPGQYDHWVTDFQAFETLGCGFHDLNPGLGGALIALQGSLFEADKRGAEVADGEQVNHGPVL